MDKQLHLIQDGYRPSKAISNLSMIPDSFNRSLSVKYDDGYIEEVSISDSYGRKVYQKTLNRTLLSVDVSSIPSGIYLVEVCTENGNDYKRISIA